MADSLQHSDPAEDLHMNEFMATLMVPATGARLNVEQTLGIITAYITLVAAIDRVPIVLHSLQLVDTRYERMKPVCCDLVRTIYSIKENIFTKIRHERLSYLDDLLTKEEMTRSREVLLEVHARNRDIKLEEGMTNEAIDASRVTLEHQLSGLDAVHTILSKQINTMEDPPASYSNPIAMPLRRMSEIAYQAMACLATINASWQSARADL
jgi:hypothetical protein